MSSTKRILGDYTIESLNGNVNIIGNLVVAGSTTSVTHTDTKINDNIITLNAGETGSGVTLGTAGIEVDRGPGQFVPSVIWNDGTGHWQFSNDGVVFTNLGSGGGGGGGGLTAVYEDPNPSLSANLNIGNHTIYSSTKNVILQAGTPSGGGSGLYVTNTANTNEELATNKAAITYSIIFG